MAADLAPIAKRRGIINFLTSFVDLFGSLRAKLVPTQAIKDRQRDSAGFAAWLDVTPAHPDMFARPDPDSHIQLPWGKEIGWLASDLWMDGREVSASPRVALKRQLARARKSGYRTMTGVQCEFILVNPEGTEISDPAEVQAKPCYDRQVLMRRYPVTPLQERYVTRCWNWDGGPI